METETKTGTDVALITPVSGPIQSFAPNSYDGVLEYSKLLSASGDMVPKGYSNNYAKIAVAIYYGYELGMPPLQALQSIAVINGKPSIYGDAALALVRSSGLLEDFKETYEGGDIFLEAPEYDHLGKLLKPGKINAAFKAVCTITRKGEDPVVSEFSVMDAMLAGLWNKEGPWRNYPKRMLKFRARGFGLRDVFADRLRGLILTEEAQDYDLELTAEPSDRVAPTPGDDGDGDDGGDAPGTGGAEPGKRKRGRPKKNQYQIEGETVKGDAPKPEESSAPKADAPKDEKPAAQNEAPKPEEEGPEPEEEKPQEQTAPAPADDEAPKPDGDDLVDVGSVVSGFDKLTDDQKEFLSSMHDDLYKASEMEGGPTSVRGIWGSWFNKRGPLPETPEEKAVYDEFYERMKEIRSFHKERVAGGGESTAGGVPAGSEFDFAAFKKDLEEQLKACESPADVNRVFNEVTEIPMRSKLVSSSQFEKELKPLWMHHLERVDV